MKDKKADQVLARFFKNRQETKLRVSDWLECLAEQNKAPAADLIFYRLYGRYIKPFNFRHQSFQEEYKDGFSMMANCCLLIETLVSFREGWEDTRNRSEEAFRLFFARNGGFKITKDKVGDFYKNVRCGILHQGETANGWRISRVMKDPLLKHKTINANKFSKCLEESLNAYVSELKNDSWDSEVWDNCRRKMRAIMRNCNERR